MRTLKAEHAICTSAFMVIIYIYIYMLGGGDDGFHFLILIFNNY
jgi:hypothetical protein